MNLNTGSNYLSSCEIERNNNIVKNRLLYKGKGKNVFCPSYLDVVKGIVKSNKFFDNYLEKEYAARYTSINLVKPCVDALSNLLFAEGVQVQSESNAEDLQKIVDEIKLSRTCLKAEKSSKLTGNSILTAWLDEQGNPKLSVIPAENWFPIAYSQDLTMIQSHLIVTMYTEKDNKTVKESSLFGQETNGTKKFLSVKRYEANKTYYEAYFLEGDTVLGCMPWDNDVMGYLPSQAYAIYYKESETVERWVEEHNCPYPLCFNVPNSEIDDSVFGQQLFSDDFYSKLEEINNRLTQNRRIMDKNSDPVKLLKGDDALSNLGIQNVEDGNGGQVSIKALDKEKMVLLGDDGEMSLLEMSQQLESNFEQINKCSEFCLQEIGLNKAITGGSSEALGVLSGVALETLYNIPLQEASAKKRPWTDEIKKIINSYRYLLNQEIFLDLNVVFQDGIKIDSKTQAEVNVIRNGGKPVVSQETSVREANPNATNVWVENEVEKINAGNSVGFTVGEE